MLAPNVHSGVIALQKSKAPLGDIVPDLTVGNELQAAVSAKAPHPNGARLLINFLLSPQGQAVINKDVASSVLPNIPGAVPLPKDYRSPNLAEVTANHAKLLGLIGIH